MPRVKINYVVSFSSESTEAPASNLLASEAGRGRWLCARGEPSCSVLLQLPKAVQISSITVGAHLAALVEVLVGRSETPNDPFQVLVASSVFFSPIESRRATEGDTAADKVRTFNADQLSADVRSKRWDRVRVVCSQPYNKHCKYGLSFIHIFSPEVESEDKNANVTVEKPAMAVSDTAAKPALKLPLDLSPQDSDDDDLKPGALFAQHRASQSQSQESTSSNTDAQIRKATSQAIKNVFSSSTKIVRTPISKPKGDATVDDESRSNRTRDSLLYEDEDASPHDKIDRLVAAHKDQQAKNAENTNKEKEKQHKDKEKTSREKAESSSRHKRDHSKEEHSRTPRDKYKDKNRDETRKDKTDDRRSSHSSQKERHRTKERSKSPQSSKRDRSSPSKRDRDEGSSKKQKASKEQDDGKTLHAGPLIEVPHRLLRDVVFVISGYENPRRAGLRDAALAMGASYQRDWSAICTHLICAFPNTPKLRTVRSMPDGDKAIVVTGEWIERQAERRRRLPWQWFATEPKFRVKRARAASGEDPPGSKRDSTSIKSDDSDSELTPSGSADPCPEQKSKINKEEVRPDSEYDTDDEIERVMLKKAQKRERISSEEESPSKKRKTDKDLSNLSQASSSSAVAFVRDERIKARLTLSDSDDDATDKENVAEDSQDLSAGEGLPSFFEGCTFAVESASKPVLDEKLVRRYVKAYGGEIVEALDDDDEVSVDYVVCLRADGGGGGGRARGRGRGRRVRGRGRRVRGRGRRVRGEWVWRCHERGRLCSPGEFAL